MNKSNYKIIVWTVIIIGIAIRLIQFFFNRSLMLSEVSLAVSVIDHNVSVFKPLANNQVAPVLFLFIVRFFVSVFGNSEMVLRAFPLIMSILTFPFLKLFVEQASKNKIVVILTLILYSVAPLLIRYSSELKQYTVDVFFTVLLLSLAISNRRNKYLLLLILGSASIFFSNVIVLILFSIGIFLTFQNIHHWKTLRKVIGVCLIWLSFFGLYYAFFIHNHPTKDFMNKYWDFAFMPTNFGKLDTWLWLPNELILFFKNLILLNLKTNWILYALLGINSCILFLGFLYIAKNKIWIILFYTLIPILLHLVISALHLYPFHGRLLLYYSPMVIILMAFGIYFLYELALKVNKRLSFLVIGLLLGNIIAANTAYFPIKKEEIKESIEYVETNIVPGQQIYVYGHAVMAFQYYKKRGIVNFENVKVWCHEDRIFHSESKLEAELLKGETWFLFSHINRVSGYSDYKDMLEYLGQNGIILQSFETVGSAAYLIDMNQTDK